MRTGDARALGEVFDAAAPELLKIAAYVARDRQLAEDLVQSTFLVAIERRTEFDTSRSVMPWLCGIVANLARAERRRIPLPERRPEASSSADPASAAQLTEFRAAFQQARDGLGGPYGAVLELHLDHGLRAKEIARVLDRPAGTVRAQIARGLDMLRRRLPGGFVASAVVSPVAVDALPAMRMAVLAHARAAAAGGSVAVMTGVAPWTAALNGAGIMNKKLVVAGVVGTFLVALGFWQGRGGGEDVRPEASAGMSVASRPARSERASDPAGLPVEPVRVAVADEGAAADVPAPVGRIEVTVRWQSDGAPAVSQAVEVVCVGQSLAETRPRRALTDAAGVCAIDNVPAGDVTVLASTGQRQRTTVQAGATNAITFELKAWGIVRGVVVDAYGVSVPGADVWVSSEISYRSAGRGDRPGRGQYGSFTMRTDAAGRFETRLGLKQSVSASKPGYGPSPTIYACSGKAPPDGIDVTLKLAAEGSTLIVAVGDAHGAPVADAHVLVGPETPHLLDQTMTRATPPPRRTNTDERGAAELTPLPTGKLPVQVRARGFAPWHGRCELPPGGVARLPVLLVPAATLRGIVTDENGSPVPQALVYHGRISELASSSCTTDANGSFELDSLPEGELELTAWKEGVGTCAAVRHVESGNSYAWHPLLTMRPAIVGIVRDVAGKPVAGAYVACANTGDRSDSLTGSTDANGGFLLGPLKQGGSYDVVAEVLDQRRGALRVLQRGVPPGAEVVLQVAPGEPRTAGLCGRLLEPDGSPATRVHMTATPTGGMGYFIGVEQNGEFATGASKAGRVRLVVRRQGLVIADLGDHDLVPNRVVDLGDVYLPMTGGAVLRIAGGDVVNGVVDLYRDGLAMSSRRLDGNEMRWDTLPPGDYTVSLRRAGPQPVTGAATFRVTGGSAVRVTLTVGAAHRCELRFVVAEPCRRTGTLIVENANGAEVLRHAMQRPPDGETARLLLPAGDVRLRFRSDDDWHGQLRASVPSRTEMVMVLTK